MRLFLLEFTESLRIAWEQVNAHRMRALLTALGVIIGIVAVTLMGTAIRGIDKGFANNLQMLGTDIFYIQQWPWSDPGDDWFKYRNRKLLEPNYAEQVNAIAGSTPDSHILAAVPTVEQWWTIERGELWLRDVSTHGTLPDYPLVSTANIAEGRFFTETEERSAASVAVIGSEVAEILFPGISPVGLTVKMQGLNFTVIGVYEKQGNFLGLVSFDRRIVIPLKTMRKFYTGNWGVSILIKARENAPLNLVEDEIEGAMRRVRALKPGAANDFEINRSAALEERLAPTKRSIALGGIFITGLSLFVGAIGIMNITFVSVKERTREIGTRRALGARKRAILMQFLTEAVVICIIGGIVGILITSIMQILAGRIFPQLPIGFSADLVLVGLLVSVTTGLIAGFAPALTASKMDPAVAIRHEN